MTEAAALALGFLLAALLYASAGQAGATGYLGIMAFTTLPPEAMKPTALALNLVAAALLAALVQRNGAFSWRSFLPFGALGAPLSLLGGALRLPGEAYRPAVGALLLPSALLTLRPRRPGSRPPPEAPPVLPALAAGGAVGLVSGLTGIGGGVFLAPLILATNWMPLRQAAAVTAGFNLLNTVAALAGTAARMPDLPPELPLWMAGAGIGGLAGGAIGLYVLSEAAARRLLALALAISGAKLVLG